MHSESWSVPGADILEDPINGSRREKASNNRRELQRCNICGNECNFSSSVKELWWSDCHSESWSIPLEDIQEDPSWLICREKVCSDRRGNLMDSSVFFKSDFWLFRKIGTFIFQIEASHTILPPPAIWPDRRRLAMIYYLELKVDSNI